MSDKPVYQQRREFDEWEDIPKDTYDMRVNGKYQVRILYPAADFEALKAENEAQAKRIAELETKESTAIEHLTQVVEEMNHLMNDSEGVAGLHQNGDIAPWASLLRGGEFEEWLSYLSDAVEFAQSYYNDTKDGEKP